MPENEDIKMFMDGEVAATVVYDKLDEAYQLGMFNVFILEGGSRSSKTISIVQFWLKWAQDNEGTEKKVIVSRAVGTWIEGTVLADFIKVLKAYGWYEEKNHNKTKKIYKLFDTEFWFVGLDDQQKLHGMTSDAFWINEAIEATKNDFDQVEMRCAGFGIIDYNPSEEEHWIYDNVCKRTDACFIHSTMLDNAFLPENMRRKILSYDPSNPVNISAGTANKKMWEIYGLGLRAKIEGLVFENGITLVNEIPTWIKNRYTGLDFGYSEDPTAIGEIAFQGNDLFIHELCYQTKMLSSDIIKKLKDVNNSRDIISESADPRLIDEIYNAGFKIYPVEKGKDSIQAGLDKMKTMKIHVTSNSINAIKEFKNYTHKQDKNGKWLNEPIDDWNHIIDLTRYIVLMKILGRRTEKKKMGWASALP